MLGGRSPWLDELQMFGCRWMMLIASDRWWGFCGWRDWNGFGWWGLCFLTEFKVCVGGGSRPNRIVIKHSLRGGFNVAENVRWTGSELLKFKPWQYNHAKLVCRFFLFLPSLGIQKKKEEIPVFLLIDTLFSFHFIFAQHSSWHIPLFHLYPTLLGGAYWSNVSSCTRRKRCWPFQVRTTKYVIKVNVFPSVKNNSLEISFSSCGACCDG